MPGNHRVRQPSSVKNGRRSGGAPPAKILHVTDLPCPADPAGGNHDLILRVEDSRPVSRCRHCNETWAWLDALTRTKGKA